MTRASRSPSHCNTACPPQPCEKHQPRPRWLRPHHRCLHHRRRSRCDLGVRKVSCQSHSAAYASRAQHGEADAAATQHRLRFAHQRALERVFGKHSIPSAIFRNLPQISRAEAKLQAPPPPAPFSPYMGRPLWPAGDRPVLPCSPARHHATRVAAAHLPCGIGNLFVMLLAQDMRSRVLL